MRAIFHLITLTWLASGHSWAAAESPCNRIESDFAVVQGLSLNGCKETTETLARFAKSLPEIQQTCRTYESRAERKSELPRIYGSSAEVLRPQREDALQKWAEERQRWQDHTKNVWLTTPIDGRSVDPMDAEAQRCQMEMQPLLEFRQQANAALNQALDRYENALTSELQKQFDSAVRERTAPQP